MNLLKYPLFRERPQKKGKQEIRGYVTVTHPPSCNLAMNNSPSENRNKSIPLHGWIRVVKSTSEFTLVFLSRGLFTSRITKSPLYDQRKYLYSTVLSRLKFRDHYLCSFVTLQQEKGEKHRRKRKNREVGEIWTRVCPRSSAERLIE